MNRFGFFIPLFMSLTRSYQVWKLLFIVVIFDHFMSLILFPFDCRSEPPYEETLIVPPPPLPFVVLSSPLAQLIFFSISPF
ncbi:hypothetical protein HanRHA438_Chr05g0246731 [Helianthus annuus]|nr:hypothetical protein HanRHA438_Chr05g0246731 [Helianthus annuus]